MFFKKFGKNFNGNNLAIANCSYLTFDEAETV